MSEEKKINPAKSFLNGGFGGICNVIVGHPLDTIKVKLQTMPSPAPGAQPMYTGTLDCAKKIIKADGFMGLYRGIQAPLTGVAPIFAVCFAGFSLGKRLQQSENNLDLKLHQIAFAGAFSGIFSTLITAPGERIKCLLQTQGDSKKYNGMIDCAVKLFKEGGIRSVFRGGCATLLRDVPANGMYFLVYEYLQQKAKQSSSGADNTLLTSLFSGGVAGMSYWILGMPADVLKSRLQTAPEGTYKHGIRSVFAELMKKDGPAALYRGVTPVMLRAFPANAACFFGIELSNTFLTKMGL